MTKRIFSTLSALILCITLNAQDGIEIRIGGTGPDISGGTHSTSLYASSPELLGGVYEVHFHVINNTGADQQWRVVRKELNVPTTWVDDLCWPPLCYPNLADGFFVTPHSPATGSPAPIIVNGTSTTTNAELAELKPKIYPDQSTAGYAHYRYYLRNVTTGVYDDSVDLELGFVLGVNTVKQAPTLSLQPNPASEILNLSLGSIDNATVRVVDVLGNVVYTDSVKNGSDQINVSEFKNGVYFVMVEAPGIKSMNRKLIVRH